MQTRNSICRLSAEDVFIFGLVTLSLSFSSVLSKGIEPRENKYDFKGHLAALTRSPLIGDHP